MVIVGGDELAAGKVKIRDMRSHEELLVDRASVAEAVSARL